MTTEITLDAVRLALSLQQRRAEIAGANIAGANTPGFVAQRLDAGTAKAWLAQAASGFVPAGAAPTAASLGSVADVDAVATSTDAQVADMVAASVEFQALSETLNRHFGLLRLAVSGRSA